MHKRQVRNQRHFIQPLTCYGSVLNVLLKIPQHEANHKFTFTGQSEKKKKEKKKKPSTQKRRTRSTCAISTGNRTFLSVKCVQIQ